MIEEKPNYRSIGRSLGKINSLNRSGKLKNTVNGEVKTSAPSVPSKWEPITVEHNKQAKKGFGSQGDRFYKSFTEIASLNAQPGPGLYHEEKKEMILKGPSLSKKGYGNSFLSKVNKLDSYIEKSITPGPGEYDTKDTLTIEQANKKGSTAFIQSGNGRVPYVDHLIVAEIPGPANYDALKYVSEFNCRDKKPSASYQSKVERAKFLIKKSVAPPPGTYDTPDHLPRVSQEIIWAMSKVSKVSPELLRIPETPAPTRYFNSTSQDDQAVKTLRTVGNFQGPFADKQANQPHRHGVAFGEEGDRFRNTFLGKLHQAGEKPGPGWYDPLLYSATANGSHPDARPTATFRSTSATRVRFERPNAVDVPGPGEYNLLPVSPKKFGLNVDGRWE